MTQAPVEWWAQHMGDDQAMLVQSLWFDAQHCLKGPYEFEDSQGEQMSDNVFFNSCLTYWPNKYGLMHFNLHW